MKQNYAAIAYEAYRSHTGGISLATGHAIPEWHELRQDIQLAWQQAALAVENQVLADMESAILAEAAANGIEATTWAEAVVEMGRQLREAREDVRRLSQANADLRKERDRAVQEAKRQHTLAKGAREQADNFAAHCETAVQKADALTDDRDALAADNARLREALGKIRDRALALGLDRGDSVTMLIAEEALTATPDQYLAAHISSLHKSVDGPLPEIESITTTGEENGDSYRQIIQAGIDDLAKNAEGVADGQ